jgi:hypothetical protein
VNELFFSASRLVDLVAPRAEITGGRVIPSDDSVFMCTRVFVRVARPPRIELDVTPTILTRAEN